MRTGVGRIPNDALLGWATVAGVRVGSELAPVVFRERSEGRASVAPSGLVLDFDAVIDA